MVPELQLDARTNSSDKLQNLIDHISTQFVSLTKASTQQAMENFKDAKVQTFLQMINNDKAQLDKELKLIDEALVEGGKIYKSCLILTNFTTEIDKQIENCRG